MKWKAQQKFHVHQSRCFLCRGESCFSLTGLQKYPKTLSTTLMYFRWGKKGTSTVLLPFLFPHNTRTSATRTSSASSTSRGHLCSQPFQVLQTGSMFSSPHNNKGISPKWKCRIPHSCQIIPSPVFHSISSQIGQIFATWAFSYFQHTFLSKGWGFIQVSNVQSLKIQKLSRDTCISFLAMLPPRG